MRAVDTSILARFLMADDPAQHALARAVLREPAFIPATVLVELAWLLSSRYRLPRAVVAAAMLGLLELPTVQVQQEALTRWAIGRFADGADLGDMLHLMAARDASAFMTFDEALAAAAGPDAPIAVQVPTA